MAATGLSAGLVHGLNTGDVGREMVRLLAAGIVQLPAVWVLTGLCIALFGLLPRMQFLSWVAFAGFVLLTVFGELLRFPDWALDLSPFTHIPRLPGGEVTASPLVWLMAIATVLVLAGLIGFRQRDVSRT